MKITKFYLLLYFIYFIGKCQYGHCGTLKDSERLVSDLLHDYDSLQRPVLDQTTPVIVNCTFMLKAIHDFFEVEGRLSVKGTLFMEWTDESMKWNATNYGYVTSFPFPQQNVWYPKVILLNSFDETNIIGDEWTDVRISSDGRARLYGSNNLDIYCVADITYFPFDNQSCALIFIAFANTADEIQLHIGKLPSDITINTQTIENREWVLYEISSQSVRDNIRPDLFVVKLLIGRKSGFFILMIFLPVILMSFMNIMVFILPAEEGERVSYTITVLLSLAIYMTALLQHMPKISKPIPLICFYLMFIVLQSGLICVVTIVNLRMFLKPLTEPVPNYLCCFKRGPRNFSNNIERNTEIHEAVDAPNEAALDPAAVKSDLTWQEVSQTLDKIYFILFLVTATFCNVIYFTVSLMQNEIKPNNLNPLTF